MTKSIFKSKEVWVAVIGLLNYGLAGIGWPSIEPTPELLAAIIGALLAIRVLFTETKLSLKND